MTNYRTIKIKPETYRELKVLAAERGVTMLALLNELVAQARERADSNSRHAGRGEAAADAKLTELS
jgi:hypothetical protein